MHTEIEATFLEVDHDALRKRLQALNAKCEQPLFIMSRTVYDYPDLRLDKDRSWLRVRKEADKTTVAFKHRESEAVDGMKEIELEVSSYKDMCGIFEAIGLKQKAVQETKREVWRLEACEIMLEEWPWIPPYVEVEGPDEASVRNISEKLGFTIADAMFDSVDNIYRNYFDVTRTEISTVPIAFGPVPDWLEKKRRV
jgi:adenylate cyclase, class 2